MIKDFNLTHLCQADTASSSQRNDYLAMQFDPNFEFQNYDFHPNVSEGAQIPFTYAANIENLRISVNMMIKKPVNKPFQTNSKKAIISI